MINTRSRIEELSDTQYFKVVQEKEQKWEKEGNLLLQEVTLLEKEVYHLKEVHRRVVDEKTQTEKETDELRRVEEDVQLQLKKELRALENTRSELEMLQTQHVHEMGSNLDLRFIAAIVHLKQRNCIIGTLSEICWVDQKYKIALNSVLSPIIKNTVLVRNKSDALKVIEYFTKEKIGVVKCEIVSEQGRLSRISSSESCKGLTNLSSVIHTILPEYLPIVEKYTCSWYVAKDLQTAKTLSYQKEGCQYRRSIVTLVGEMFHSSGEIRYNNISVQNSPLLIHTSIRNISDFGSVVSNHRSHLITIQDTQDRMSSIETSITSLRKQLSEVRSRQRSSSLSSFGEQEKRLLSDIQFKESCVSELKSRISYLKPSEPDQTYVKEIKEEIRALEDRYNTMIQLNNPGRLEACLSSYHELRTQLQALENEVTELRIKRESVEQNHASFGHAIDQLERKLTRYSELESETQEKIDVLLKEITTFDVNITQLKEKKQGHQNEVRRIQLLYEDNNSKIQKTSGQFKKTINLEQKHLHQAQDLLLEKEEVEEKLKEVKEITIDKPKGLSSWRSMVEHEEKCMMQLDSEKKTLEAMGKLLEEMRREVAIEVESIVLHYLNHLFYLSFNNTPSSWCRMSSCM